MIDKKGSYGGDSHTEDYLIDCMFFDSYSCPTYYRNKGDHEQHPSAE